MDNSGYREQAGCEDAAQVPSTVNTCAVVITHFPDDGIISRLRRIHRQLPAIIIIDNASSGRCRLLLQEFSLLPTVELLENSENEGIGKALNQAAGIAGGAGFSWMLTLDQDTLVHDGMFAEIVAVYKSSGGHSPLIGSNYRDVLRERQLLECGTRPDGAFVEQRTVITSGTLVSLDLFRRIGGFREDYFIDSVDHEYCLRTRAHGFRVVISCKPLMSHSIGRAGSRTSRLLVFDHPPVRKYYIARNTLVTLKAYFRREPAWAMRQVVRLTVELVSIALFEREKRHKGYAFWRGIMDAMRNRMGRCTWV